MRDCEDERGCVACVSGLEHAAVQQGYRAASMSEARYAEPQLRDLLSFWRIFNERHEWRSPLPHRTESKAR